MNIWHALAGRVTLFPAVSVEQPAKSLPSALELFQQIWNGSPDSFQKAPNPLLPSVAQGKHADLVVGCSIQPARIDFNFSPTAPETQQEQPQLPLILNTRQLYEEFERVATQLQNGTFHDSIARVAFFVHFVCLVSSQSEANKVLLSVMPKKYQLGLTDEEEFILQLNRPRQSAAVQGVRMNYIDKWSVDRFQLLTLTMPVVGGTPVTQPASVVLPNEIIAASIAFDFNNIPANKRLSGAEQGAILLESLHDASKMQKDYGVNAKEFGRR